MKIVKPAAAASGINVTVAVIPHQSLPKHPRSPVRQLPVSSTPTAGVMPRISWCPAIMLTAHRRHSAQALCAVHRNALFMTGRCAQRLSVLFCRKTAKFDGLFCLIFAKYGGNIRLKRGEMSEGG